MDSQSIENILKAEIAAEAVSESDHEVKQPFLVIAGEYLQKVCLFLRDDPRFYFDFLASLSGVDLGPEANEMQVVYHLTSLTKGLNLVLKVKLERRADPLPSVPSVREVWRTADWHERETYDLMGIHFEGHPDLRRILLPQDWEGHPLRKDYDTADEYHGIEIDY